MAQSRVGDYQKAALVHAALQGPCRSQAELMDHPAITRALELEGRITFARYMQMALYHPRWGYYSRLTGLGESGDFYTSPELHPLFAAAVAVRAGRLWQAM